MGNYSGRWKKGKVWQKKETILDFHTEPLYSDTEREPSNGALMISTQENGRVTKSTGKANLLEQTEQNILGNGRTINGRAREHLFHLINGHIQESGSMM